MNERDEWDISAAQIKRAHGYSTPTNQRRLNESAREAGELAEEILRFARSQLLVNLRFLEPALLEIVPKEELVTAETATDGRFLFYNSAHVCRLWQKGRELPARNYLHSALHCIFLHLFTGRRINPDYWDLACDIAAENVINGLELRALSCGREQRQRALLERLRAELPLISAETVYRWLREQEFPIPECARLRADFYADDHAMWHKSAEAQKGSGESDRRGGAETEGGPDGDQQADDGEELEPPSSEDDGSEASGDGAKARRSRQRSDDGARGGEGGGERRDEPAPAPRDGGERWRDIANRVKLDLETFSKSWGESAGSLLQNLAAIHRERYDYSEFLRRFAVYGENMEVNDEEFDYIFYTYGLSIYKNMPLVEPLEYRDVRRIREFVIALDTSESVAGPLVQRFVQKTWNILKQSENFFTKVNVHIIQCGARVEEDAKITSQDEFDSYMARMTLRGFGGTDFRPVFEYVNGLIRRREFLNFKGMIYFTDGCGDFPAMPPEYETAFVFIDQGRELPRLPAWAMRLVLTGDELENL